MIRSMTGFGRAEVTAHDRKFTVEIKSVNHRYLEMSVRLPKTLNAFESAVRQELKKYMTRGKVDVYISYENLGEASAKVRYNKELAAEYLGYLREMASDFSLDDDIRVSTLSKYPDVFTMEETEMDEEEFWQDLKAALDQAAENFVQTRITEGEHLKDDLLEKLEHMGELVDFVETRSPQIIAEYRQKIDKRVRDILGDVHVDENRLLTEVTVFADRICVDEEIVRLHSHLATVKKELTEGKGDIGKKLDFLVQELNRESNTILSKSTDLEISNCGIELKTTIEKIREQIQNIE